MVDFQKSSKFYARNSVGKYPLDVDEIRNAFNLSQSSRERIRDFRRERLSMLIGDEALIPLQQSANVVLHIIPLGAFETDSIIDISIIYNSCQSNSFLFEPMFPEGYSNHQITKYNFDGCIKNYLYDKSKIAYLQFFRNGIIESVTSCFSHVLDNNQKILNKEYEVTVINKIKDYFDLLKKTGVDFPVFVMLSLLGVKNCDLNFNPRNLPIISKFLIDRDNLIMPEFYIEDYNENLDLPKIMKPVFDQVWNAAGYPQSLNYDQNSNWNPSR